MILLQVICVNRALSINGKRRDITFADLLKIADSYTIKSPKQVIEKVNQGIYIWLKHAQQLVIPEYIIAAIQKDFVRF